MSQPLFDHITDEDIKRHYELWAQSEKFAQREVSVELDVEQIKRQLQAHPEYGLMVSEVCIRASQDSVKSPTVTDAIFTMLD